MTDTSTVERFRPYAIYDGGVRSGMEPCNFGGWVRYEDCAALLAERDALQAERDGHWANHPMSQSAVASFEAAAARADALQAKVDKGREMVAKLLTLDYEMAATRGDIPCFQIKLQVERGLAAWDYELAKLAKEDEE